MSHEEDETLRAAFQARQAEAGGGGACPPAADLWSAVRGEGTIAERRAVIDHTSACGACAAAWRLAMEVSPAPISPVLSSRSVFASRRWRPLAAAAALVLALGGGGLWLTRSPAHVDVPGFRGAVATIRSLSSEGTPLARDDFRLRWSGAPAGSRYDVRVTTESLDVVASAQRLTEPAFLVPEAALAALPAGSRILWRVDAVLPDGDRAASPTFVVRLR